MVGARGFEPPCPTPAIVISPNRSRLGCSASRKSPNERPEPRSPGDRYQDEAAVGDEQRDEPEDEVDDDVRRLAGKPDMERRGKGREDHQGDRRERRQDREDARRGGGDQPNAAGDLEEADRRQERRGKRLRPPHPARGRSRCVAWVKPAAMTAGARTIWTTHGTRSIVQTPTGSRTRTTVTRPGLGSS